MSDELAQDDEGGFEIASIGGSELDEDEERDEDKDKDLEARAGMRNVTPVPQVVVHTSEPQTQQQQPAVGESGRRGRSIDEPIFEVGEGDGWSDGEVMTDDEEESSDEDDKKEKNKASESKRLTGK